MLATSLCGPYPVDGALSNHVPFHLSLTTELRSLKEEHIVAQLDGIIESAFKEAHDRLQNGDAKVIGGEIVRVPVSGRDATWMGAVAVDKRQLILIRPTSISGKAEDMTALIERFEILARESQAKIVSEQ